MAQYTHPVGGRCVSASQWAALSLSLQSVCGSPHIALVPVHFRGSRGRIIDIQLPNSISGRQIHQRLRAISEGLLLATLHSKVIHNTEQFYWLEKGDLIVEKFGTREARRYSKTFDCGPQSQAPLSPPLSPPPFPPSQLPDRRMPAPRLTGTKVISAW